MVHLHNVNNARRYLGAGHGPAKCIDKHTNDEQVCSTVQEAIDFFRGREGQPMLLGELADKLEELCGKHGPDTEVVITGVYGSAGDVLEVSWDSGAVLLGSDIMSG